MLRPCNDYDLPQMVKIESDTQASPWSEDIFKKCLEAGSSVWVMDLSGNIIGFIIVLFQAEEGHVLNLCIHPEYQHQGYGHQLLKHALECIKEKGGVFVYLEVRRSNKNAIALYQKMGFKQVGERKDYYVSLPKREDALIFAKDLSAE